MCRSVLLLATLVALASSAFVPLPEVKTDNLSGRIVGGRPTDISKHPHQVSMRYKSCDICSFNHRCGGSIITPQIILTAAHCVVGIKNPKDVHVVAGANHRNGHGVVYPVRNISSHELYGDNVSFENDIAILILALPIQLNSYDVKAIELTDKKPVCGAIATVTGWGTTTEGGYASDQLLEVDVPIVANDICEAKYGTGKINESMLCAGSVKGGKDACQGDSGGPLLVNRTLAGVVSWGYGCARPEYPGVYASVADLREWIDNAIKNNT